MYDGKYAKNALRSIFLFIEDPVRLLPPHIPGVIPWESI